MRSYRERLVLMLACNDPDNGAFTGKFDLVEVLDPKHHILLSLSGPTSKMMYGGVGASELKGLTIFRTRIIVDDEITRFGNWCWNAYPLGYADAVRALNLLKCSGFEAEGGNGDAWDLWHADGPITEAQLREVCGFPIAPPTSSLPPPPPAR